MLFRMVFALSVALEFIFAAWFLEASWPRNTRKSLALKTVCSALFVLAGVSAAGAAKNMTPFAFLILGGLLAGMLGDFFLHISRKTAASAAGLLFFLTGHLLYISAFLLKQREYMPDLPLFSAFELAAAGAMFAAVVALALAKKIELNAAAAPVAFYAATLIVMFIKATSLGVHIAEAGKPGAVAAFLLLAFGSLMFVVSDALLGIIHFAGEKKNRPMKIISIAAYIAAQLMLASTLFVIR
ncbi:MAG TPA: lysoplasmalogenase family protein [Clostridiales bacterium]|nr:lysoplasmalogenase family protein [Clostridiales bacterium]